MSGPQRKGDNMMASADSSPPAYEDAHDDHDDLLPFQSEFSSAEYARDRAYSWDVTLDAGFYSHEDMYSVFSAQEEALYQGTAKAIETGAMKDQLTAPSSAPPKSSSSSSSSAAHAKKPEVKKPEVKKAEIKKTEVKKKESTPLSSVLAAQAKEEEQKHKNEKDAEKSSSNSGSSNAEKDSTAKDNEETPAEADDDGDDYGGGEEVILGVIEDCDPAYAGEIFIKPKGWLTAVPKSVLDQQPILHPDTIAEALKSKDVAAELKAQQQAAAAKAKAEAAIKAKADAAAAAAAAKTAEAAKMKSHSAMVATNSGGMMAGGADIGGNSIVKPNKNDVNVGSINNSGNFSGSGRSGNDLSLNSAAGITHSPLMGGMYNAYPFMNLAMGMNFGMPGGGGDMSSGTNNGGGGGGGGGLVGSHAHSIGPIPPNFFMGDANSAGMLPSGLNLQFMESMMAGGTGVGHPPVPSSSGAGSGSSNNNHNGSSSSSSSSSSGSNLVNGEGGEGNNEDGSGNNNGGNTGMNNMGAMLGLHNFLPGGMPLLPYNPNELYGNPYQNMMLHAARSGSGVSGSSLADVSSYLGIAPHSMSNLPPPSANSSNNNIINTGNNSNALMNSSSGSVLGLSGSNSASNRSSNNRNNNMSSAMSNANSSGNNSNTSIVGIYGSNINNNTSFGSGGGGGRMGSVGATGSGPSGGPGNMTLSSLMGHSGSMLDNIAAPSMHSGVVGLNHHHMIMGGHTSNTMGSSGNNMMSSSSSALRLYEPQHNADGSDHRIGAYTREERQQKIEKFRMKKRQRIWQKQIKYDCRKRLADTRPRIKGRFVRNFGEEGEEEDMQSVSPSKDRKSAASKISRHNSNESVSTVGAQNRYDEDEEDEEDHQNNFSNNSGAPPKKSPRMDKVQPPRNTISNSGYSGGVAPVAPSSSFFNGVPTSMNNQQGMAGFGSGGVSTMNSPSYLSYDVPRSAIPTAQAAPSVPLGHAPPADSGDTTGATAATSTADSKALLSVVPSSPAVTQPNNSGVVYSAAGEHRPVMSHSSSSSTSYVTGSPMFSPAASSSSALLRPLLPPAASPLLLGATTARMMNGTGGGTPVRTMVGSPLVGSYFTKGPSAVVIPDDANNTSSSSSSNMFALPPPVVSASTPSHPTSTAVCADVTAPVPDAASAPITAVTTEAESAKQNPMGHADTQQSKTIAPVAPNAVSDIVSVSAADAGALVRAKPTDNKPEVEAAETKED